jgi:hypothetical protein
LAQETHALVTTAQVIEEPLESVLFFVSGNAMQLLRVAWKLILSGIDAADTGSLNQPILKSGTDDNEPLTAASLPSEQQKPFGCLYLLIADQIAWLGAAGILIHYPETAGGLL